MTMKHVHLAYLFLCLSGYHCVFQNIAKTKKNGKASTLHCRMNVEQAVAIDVCSVLFINNLLIYSHSSNLIVLDNVVSANQQPSSFTCNLRYVQH